MQRITRKAEPPRLTPPAIDAARRAEATVGPADPELEGLLTNRQSAALLGIGVPTFYAMLKDRQLPPAYYVRPYTPRWKASELLAALERTRGYPDQAKGHKRRAKVLKETEQ